MDANASNCKSASPTLDRFLRIWKRELEIAGRSNPGISADILNAHAFDTAVSAGRAAERQRAFLALDWLCRISASIWLRAAGFADQAAALSDLAEIVDDRSCTAALWVMDRVTKVTDPDAMEWGSGYTAWDCFASAEACHVAIAEVDLEIALDSTGAINSGRRIAWHCAQVIAGTKDKREIEQALAPILLELQESSLELLNRMITCGPSITVASFPATQDLLSAKTVQFEQLLEALNETKGKRSLQLGEQLRLVAETYIEFSASEQERELFHALL